MVEKQSKKSLLLETVGRDSIIDAINKHDEVVIYYQSNDPGDEVLNGYRTIQPFVYGIRKDSGNPIIRAWLVGGASKTAHAPKDDLAGKPGWRTFRVDRIVNLSKTFKKFDTSETRLRSLKYNPSDKDMTTIYAFIAGVKKPLGYSSPTSKPEEENEPENKEQSKSAFGGLGHTVINTFSTLKNKFKSLFK
jgi:hypothetical protein